MNNNVLVVFVAVAVLGTGLALLMKPAPQVNVNIPERTYGSVSGPSVDGSYFTIGGVEKYYANQALFATSSTVCSVANPFGATSSILAVGMSRTATGITGTQAFYVSTTTSTGRYGSSTPAIVNNYSTGAANFAFSWNGSQASSTPATLLQRNVVTGEDTAILGPSEVLTWKIASGTPGTFSSYMTGRCTAELQKL